MPVATICIPSLSSALKDADISHGFYIKLQTDQPELNNSRVTFWGVSGSSVDIDKLIKLKRVLQNTLWNEQEHSSHCLFMVYVGPTPQVQDVQMIKSADPKYVGGMGHCKAYNLFEIYFSVFKCMHSIEKTQMG